MQTRSNTSLPPPPVRVKPAPPPRKLSVFEQEERRKRIAYNRAKYIEEMTEARETPMECTCLREGDCTCSEPADEWDSDLPDEDFDFEPNSSDEDWY